MVVFFCVLALIPQNNQTKQQHPMKKCDQPDEKIHPQHYKCQISLCHCLGFELAAI